MGTPKRWLWPLLWLFSRDQITFPVWRRDVPFTVVNRPTVGREGSPAVSASRTFRFADGDRVMVDRIGSGRVGSGGARIAGAESVGDGMLVDELGRSGRVVAVMEASVVDGALWLRSTAVSIRVAGVAVRIPTGLAPVVTLHERWEERAEEQCVSIVVEAPVVGRLYEYVGRFSHAIRQGEAAP